LLSKLFILIEKYVCLLKKNTFFFNINFDLIQAISTDICVPISKLPEVLLQTQKDIEEFKLKTIIVGHVGDGNFHTFISLDVNDKEEMKNYQAYNKKLISHALKLTQIFKRFPSRIGH
jgi:FAD/FMN-containing dehydrogenase